MRRLQGNVDFSSLSASFSPEEEKHAFVIRLNLDEEIEVLFKGEAYRGMITSLRPLKAKILETKPVPSREIGFGLVLFLPLLKRDNFEFVLDKATELGVSQIAPFISERVIKRLSAEEFEAKRERYERIIQEAVQQSNRSLAPVLRRLSKLNQILDEKADIKLFAYEDEALKGKKIAPFSLSKDQKAIALVGPEGGFSPSEAKLAVDKGFTPVSLGKRILRAETACCSLLSQIAYIGEKDA